MSFVLTYDAIAKRIDHSLLGPALTTAELEEGCRLAVRYAVASVCIKPPQWRWRRASSRARGWPSGRPSGFRTAGTPRR